jgi:uncharacterized membrane protein
MTLAMHIACVDRNGEMENEMICALFFVRCNTVFALFGLVAFFCLFPASYWMPSSLLPGSFASLELLPWICRLHFLLLWWWVV